MPNRLRRLVALVAAFLALGVQAASVQLPVDGLRLDGGTAGPAAGALERALTIDTNTSQRNLDLLLEARRAGDSASPARTGDLPAKRPALPGAQARDALVPLGLQADDSVTAPGAAERREWQGGVPGRAQAGFAGGTGSADGTGWDPARTRQADHTEDVLKFGWLRVFLADLIAFLRDNRFWLMGGAALLALAAAGLQSFSRRS